MAFETPVFGSLGSVWAYRCAILTASLNPTVPPLMLLRLAVAALQSDDCDTA